MLDNTNVSLGLSQELSGLGSSTAVTVPYTRHDVEHNFPTLGEWDRQDPFKNWSPDWTVQASILRGRFGLIPPRALSHKTLTIIKALLVLATDASEFACRLDDNSPPAARPNLQESRAKILRDVADLEVALELSPSMEGSACPMETIINPPKDSIAKEHATSRAGGAVVTDTQCAHEAVVLPKIEEDTDIHRIEHHPRSNALRTPISAAIKREDSPTPEPTVGTRSDTAA